ncbi:MAG: hypothetical protein CVT73_00560 [Alphaproteobacteria bacterium HGW-Alphaproteobacteria-12]|nr:MAG: hypothetical protein CVT73_00560 [Alphaproteobacteria bacterium HGW-Alphaproteobacteria-12]
MGRKRVRAWVMTYLAEKNRPDERTGVRAEARAHGIEFRRLKALGEPLCCDMLAYWNEVRGSRAMPHPREMDPVKFARHMPNLLMIQVNWQPFDLTYRLLGGDIVNAHGTNFRGRRILESRSHTGHFNDVLYSFYKFVAEERRPYAVGGTMEYVARGPVSVEAVYLPLSLDGTRTDRILGASVSRKRPER